ncbi:heavy-metal-associated domain-containing protein [Candidatus Woesearchaeota archaeon]|nr:heavy-metal-associated domain-containing protein [Candidatus Woesearchaeota archaeon]
MKQTILTVKGMHCKSCEVLIKDALEELGVNSCSVDHKKGTVAVNFDEKKVSLEQIKHIIKNEGYTAE